MLQLLTALILLLPQGPAPVPVEVDPALQALVQRFFETQEAEDAEAYLALWSASAPGRPRPEQLKFIFDSGDDEFTNVVITRAMVSDETARVRVMTTRVRTDLRIKSPDGSPRPMRTRLQLALSLVREAGEWRIVREGAPADELAQALVQTDDPGERRRMRDAEPDLVNVRLVEAIARRADSLAQTAQYKAAQVIYERSLEVAEAIGHQKAIGQAIQNIANSLYFQRDFERALSLYERRLGVERAAGNDEGIASALLGIATIRYASHEYGDALTTYREALAIQEKLGDDILVSTTLISTGNVLYLQGDYEAAIADYRRAEELKRAGFDLAGAASALEGLGRVYSAQGHYTAALGAFTRVLDERRRMQDVPRQALVLQSIGEIHFRLGNIDEARSSFDESRRQFESVKDVGSAGRVLQGTALNELVAGRTAVAERAYADSIARCTTANDPECIARAQVGLAFALAAQQKFDEAITWYSRSLLSFGELKMTEAAARARIGLADALLGKGDHATSLDEAAKARHDGVALGNDDLLWRALVAEARAERKLDRPAQALGAAKAALLAVGRMAAAALDRPGGAVPRDTTAAFATTAVLQAEAGDAAAAFVTAEQMRAHALRAWLAPHEREIARGMTDEEREEERMLATGLSTLIVRRDRLKDLPKQDEALLEELNGEIAAMTARRREAFEALFARLPDLRTWRGLAPAATVEDLDRLPDEPGRLVLQFIVEDREVVVIGASPSLTAHVIPVERQELGERIARALDGKALADVAAWRTASADLWQLLPPPIVEAMISASSIVIIPDGALWRVPFEAMPVGDRYLADQASVTYTTSVGALVNAPAAPPVAEGAPVLVVHSPELPAAVVEDLKITAPTWMLRSAEAGAAEAAAISPEGVEPAPVVLTGSAAVASAFRGNPDPEVSASFKRSPDPEVSEASASSRNDLPYSALHLAAPFRVNSASPLFSPLLLAAPSPAATPIKDEADLQAHDPDKKDEAPAPVEPAELIARDVFTLDPLAPSVMFSDPVALSRRDAASSLAPLAWAWRSAGASTLILRRWGGDDETASTLIGRYYEELRKGKPSVEALHAARAAIRATEAGRPPAKWAGWLTLR